MALLVAGCISAVGHPAVAATIKPHTVVTARHVRLSDLFSGIEPGVDCDLGDAPALGTSYTLGQAQLEAIARQYGVDWVDRGPVSGVVVTRAARTIDTETMIAVMRRILSARGVPDDSAVRVSGFADIKVPAEFSAAPVLVHLDSSGAHQSRFTATFSVPGDDGPIVFRVSGSYETSANILVPRRAIALGEVLTPDMFEVRTVPSGSVPDGAISLSTDVTAMIAQRMLPAGQPFTRAAIQRPLVVRLGMPVIAVYSADNLRITASGIAMDDGGIGDVVHIASAATRMQVAGTVVDHGEVEIAPGTTPLPLSPQMTARLDRNGNGRL